MGEIMGMTRVTQKISPLITCIVILTLVFTGGSVWAQGEKFATLVKARYKKGKLSLTFLNTSTEVRKAPDLSLRTDTLGQALYDDYYSFDVDTLVLNLSSEVSENLYTLTNREGGTSRGRLFYNDFLLESRQKQKSKIRIRTIPDSVKFVRIRNSLVRLRR